jgi:hypothetical protein
MSHGVPPIARIRLARSMRHLLTVPAMLLLAGGAATLAGLLLVGGLAGIAVAALGGIVLFVGLIAAAVLLSIRLDVEEAAVRISWLGGGRTYALTPGPVTRVRFRGENASRLRRGRSALAWGLGRATLRGEEAIDIVRLASTPTAILVPTETGRLAIAPASDDDLLDALSRAARARRRLDELAEAAPRPEPSIAAAPAEAAEPEPEGAPEPDEVPTTLTGIQRALLEQRLAEERATQLRAEAEAAAEAERLAAERAAIVPVEPALGEDIVEPIGRRRRREAPPTPRFRRLPRGLRRPRPRAVFVLLPIIGAGVAWGIGVAGGRMPEAGTDLARLTSLALVLAGPATSVGALLALAFWPRLVGVVVAGGLAASVFVGRALFGA